MILVIDTCQKKFRSQGFCSKGPSGVERIFEGGEVKSAIMEAYGISQFL